MRDTNVNKTKIVLAILLSGIATSNIYATNGYFSHGYGAKEKGMAGAGVAKGSSSLSSGSNPAGLLDVGDSMDAGFSMFSPVRSYTVDYDSALGATYMLPLPVNFGPIVGFGVGNPYGLPETGMLPNCTAGTQAGACQVPFTMTPETVDSGREWFLIPSFGYSSRIDEQMVWGIALYGNGGMNSSYKAGSARTLDFSQSPTFDTIQDTPGSFGAGDTGVDLMQLFVNTTIAYQASETVGLGASLLFAAQAFEATGLAPFGNNSVAPTKLTDNGHDISTGFGIKLGMNIDLSEQLTLGISYQSKIDMSEFDDYAGLFAEGGDFDIPSTYTVGLAYKTTADSTLYLDYQVILYSDVASISNGISPLLTACVDSLNASLGNPNGFFDANGNPSPASGSGCLGGSEGAGFGWDDVSAIKLGYEWSIDKDTIRVGYSTNEQPIASSELNFNLLAPGVVEDHWTVGYTSNSGENEWTAFLMYAPEVEVSGGSQFDPTQTITIRMHQLEFGFEYNF